MKRICHLTSVHDYNDDRIFYKECVSLAEAGYEVYLVAKGDSREEKGVHVIGVGDPPDKRIKRIIFFSRKVYNAAVTINADIYHFHDPELLIYGLMLKRKKKKVIFDSHENTELQIKEKKYLNKWIRDAISKIYRWIETFVVKRLDAVIVPCTFDGKNIFENRAKRTCYIANYPIIGNIDSDKTTKGNNYNNYICYVGGISYERGITYLIKAVYKAGLKLLLIGEFVDSSYEKLIREMPEFQCVEYIGKINNSEIPNTIRGCLAGANTLLDVGQYHHIDIFGVKVYEYMSVGIPVILFDSEYNKKMVEKYHFGICVKEDNVNQLVDAINKLKDNRELSSQMGDCGRKAVKKEFNWKSQEKKILNLYSLICDEL